MDRIMGWLGLISNTSAIVRLKLMLAGIGALMAGLVFSASGIEGSILRGGLMAACGAVMLGVVALSWREKSGGTPEPRSILPQEQSLPVSTCDHDWVDQDEMSNHDPRSYVCSKCGLGLVG